MTHPTLTWPTPPHPTSIGIVLHLAQVGSNIYYFHPFTPLWPTPPLHDPPHPCMTHPPHSTLPHPTPSWHTHPTQPHPHPRNSFWHKWDGFNGVLHYVSLLVDKKLPTISIVHMAGLFSQWMSKANIAKIKFSKKKLLTTWLMVDTYASNMSQMQFKCFEGVWGWGVGLNQSCG